MNQDFHILKNLSERPVAKRVAELSIGIGIGLEDGSLAWKGFNHCFSINLGQHAL